FVSGDALTIDDCVIQNMHFNGVNFAAGSEASLTVSRSRVTGNRDAGILVIAGASSGVFLHGAFEHTIFNRNGFGAVFINSPANTINFSAHDCAFTDNLDHGLLAETSAQVMVRNSSFTGNNIGVHSSNGSFVLITRSSVSANQIGLSVSPF